MRKTWEKEYQNYSREREEGRAQPFETRKQKTMTSTNSKEKKIAFDGKTPNEYVNQKIASKLSFRAKPSYEQDVNPDKDDLLVNRIPQPKQQIVQSGRLTVPSVSLFSGNYQDVVIRDCEINPRNEDNNDQKYASNVEQVKRIRNIEELIRKGQESENRRAETQRALADLLNSGLNLDKQQILATLKQNYQMTQQRQQQQESAIATNLIDNSTNFGINYPSRNFQQQKINPQTIEALQGPSGSLANNEKPVKDQPQDNNKSEDGNISKEKGTIQNGQTNKIIANLARKKDSSKNLTKIQQQDKPSLGKSTKGKSANQIKISSQKQQQKPQSSKKVSSLASNIQKGKEKTKTIH